MSDRTFKVVMSERCYRFKPDALENHAPPLPAVYEFVTFDEKREPVVLYIGLAASSLRQALADHLTGRAKPGADELFAAARDVYFDFTASTDAASPEDLQDIAAALVERHRPRLNPGPPAYTGRHARVSVEEA